MSAPRWRFLVVGICAVSLTLWTGVAQAQTNQRAGFWFAIGGGFGSVGASCDGCENVHRENDSMASLRGGWTVNPRLLVGAEFGLWSKTIEPLTLDVYHFSGIVSFYPAATSGFFVKGGIGGAYVDQEIEIKGSLESTNLGAGLGFIAGAGYDIPIAKRFSITPTFEYWYGRPGDLVLEGEKLASNWTHNAIVVSVAFTIH